MRSLAALKPEPNPMGYNLGISDEFIGYAKSNQYLEIRKFDRISYPSGRPHHDFRDLPLKTVVPIALFVLIGVAMRAIPSITVFVVVPTVVMPVTRMCWTWVMVMRRPFHRKKSCQPNFCALRITRIILSEGRPRHSHRHQTNNHRK